MNSFVSAATLLSLIAISGCKGSAKDPKTLTKDDLNPPYQLVSVTDDAKMTLQWRISNTEEDLVGYNVYVAKTSIATLKGKLTGAVASYDLGQQAIRRCELTKDLFAVFGFNATDKFAQKSCDDFEPEAKETGLTLAAEEELPSQYVKCTVGGTDVGSTGLSVDITKAKTVAGEAVSTDPLKRIDTQLVCDVPADAKLSDGTTGFTNGEKYTAFVVAVMGEKRNEISYTSNFIEDIPTTYTTLDSISLEKNQLMDLGMVGSDSTPTGVINKSDAYTVGGDLTIGMTFSDGWTTCKTANSLGCLTLAEDRQSKKERVFVIPQYKKVYIARRDPSKSILRPGDVAMKIDATPLNSNASDATDKMLFDGGKQYVTGMAMALYPGAIIDFALVLDPTAASPKIHYGKVYVESLETTADSDNGEGTKTLSLKFAFQKAVNEVFYLR